MIKKINVKYIIIGLIIFILTIIAIFIFSYNPIELKKGDVTINYGKKYKEPGYIVKIDGKDYTKKVVKTNNINYKKLGTYKIEYKVNIDGKEYKKERIVKLIDKEKPVITLKGEKNTDVCPKGKYKEEGYSAIDNYDGDITKKVKVKKEKDKITYTISDSSNNVTKIVRKLKYQDKTKPELKLNGNDNITLTVGTNYIENNATAIDNCDGDITKNIKMEGEVNVNNVGVYKITYTVTDKHKNTSTTVRTINMISEPSPNDGRPGTIYLTFDDGPNEGTTNVILDILKEEGVKATFFVTNNGTDYLIKREFDEGHTVALHTATHNYSVLYASDDAYYQDLLSVQNRVKRITGHESKIIRFPGGASNTVSRKYSPGIMSRLSQSTLAKGFKYYDWNISSGDAGGTTSSAGVYNNVVSQLKKERSNMVLMHDIKPHTRDAIRQIIEFGKSAGYSFEKITMDTPMITQRVNN